MKNNPNFKTGLEPPDILPWLAAFFNARYQGQADKSLIEIYKALGNFMEWDSDQLEALFQRRSSVLAWAGNPANRERLAGYLAEMTLARANPHGLGLPLVEKNIHSLRHIYLQGLHETLHLLATAELRNWQAAYRMLLKCHFIRLQAVLAALALRSPAGELPAKADHGVLRTEYAAEWQIKMLGLGEAPAGPALDLGCGARANLVRSLQAQGVDICGVDQAVEPEGNLIKSDWFEFPFKPDRWATVVSHLAFSSYFWFDHMNPKGETEKYLHAYMEILSSLLPGGRLVYFPSLPFLEKLLPTARYQCETREISALLPGGSPASDALTATHVLRLV
jgi:hypothetical protein